MKRDLNKNDVVRNYILNKLIELKKTNASYQEDEIDKFYDVVSDDKESFSVIINVMYLTSYIVNYYTFYKFPKEESVINNMEFLNSFSKSSELVSIIDKEIFKLLCMDTILFSSLSYYSRKKFVEKFLENKKYVLRKFPLLINDIIFYGTEFRPSCIVEEYNKRKKEVQDKSVALEDAICFGVDFLVQLEKEDIDNYCNFFKKLTEVYYMYNKYLLLNNRNLDENAYHIMNMIESNYEGLRIFSSNNGDILEPIVRDYLSYEILPKHEKEKIKIFYVEEEKREFRNPNSVVRKGLYKKFNQLYVFDQYDDEVQEMLENIKDSKVFDDIVKVLYTDFMNEANYSNLVLPEDEDAEQNFLFAKEFSNMNQFKMQLLENDTLLIDMILKSIEFYDLTMIEKKEILNTLKSNNVFKDYLVNNYLLDLLEYDRKYNLVDAYELYKKTLLEEKDRKVSIAIASSYLNSDLLDLKIFDIKNYNSIIFDLSKVFYEYNKYKLDNGLEIDENSKNLIKLIEKNIDVYFDNVTKDDQMLYSVINSFYDYVSENEENKKVITTYTKENNTIGKVKLFNKKPFNKDK